MTEIKVRTSSERPKVGNKVTRIFILRPMLVTLKQFFRSFRRPSTLMYPRERLESLDKLKPKDRFGVMDSWSFYRGCHALDEKLCIACGLCVLTCPNNAIEIVRYKINMKLPQINHGKCMFCTLCVECCPQKALSMTSDYELGQENKQDLICTPDDLIWRKEEGKLPPLPFKEKKKPDIDMNLCINCGICAKQCPVHALEMVEPEGAEPVPEGKKPKKKLVLDKSKCISCEICESKCPKEAIHMRSVDT